MTSGSSARSRVNGRGSKAARPSRPLLCMAPRASLLQPPHLALAPMQRPGLAPMACSGSSAAATTTTSGSMTHRPTPGHGCVVPIRPVPWACMARAASLQRPMNPVLAPERPRGWMRKERSTSSAAPAWACSMMSGATSQAPAIGRGLRARTRRRPSRSTAPSVSAKCQTLQAHASSRPWPWMLVGIRGSSAASMAPAPTTTCGV